MILVLVSIGMLGEQNSWSENVVQTLTLAFLQLEMFSEHSLYDKIQYRDVNFNISTFYYYYY